MESTEYKKAVGAPDKRKPFIPEEHGLESDFLLTNFSDLKGWGCKVS